MITFIFPASLYKIGIALAFRASEIMMRLNAPIPALLALAALFFLPATLLAKTSHRRAHRAASSRSGAHHKAASAKKVRASSHSKTARPAATRVSTRLTTGRHLHRAGKAVATRARTEEVASSAKSQSATSDDFIKAATAHTDATAEVREPVRRSRSHSRRSAKSVSVARRDKEKARPRDTEPAVTSAVMPVLYNKRGRLIIPPPLRGSHEILVHQNEVADRDGLDRIQNDADLINMRDKGLLVAIPTSAALQVDDRLPADRRYCRRWTERFLINLARAHYTRFHTPLQVNSAVRTVEFQEHLIRINGNAAPADGDTASPHLTGQAVDLAKHGLSRTEIAWMRGYLLPLVQEGKIDVEEEFKQSCFHISVYKNYLPPDSTPRRSIAATRSSEAALATALR